MANVAWALLNVAVAYLLLRIGSLDLRNWNDAGLCSPDSPQWRFSALAALFVSDRPDDSPIEHRREILRDQFFIIGAQRANVGTLVALGVEVVGVERPHPLQQIAILRI